MRNSKHKNHGLLRSSLLLAALTAISIGQSRAADWQPFGPNTPEIEFHGFASQGFIDSTGYNYLGSTKDGSLAFTELGLNASFNPFPRTRITAQAIAYDVGDAGKYDPILDYALAEYTFNDFIGIRAGRIQRPQGIYNDIQDVDLGRTFVLLPQAVYNARWRDFYESLDGGELFGTIPLGAAGSLTYEVYSGVVQPSSDGGLATEIETSLPANGRLDKFNWPSITGGQLWWNAPLDGLRLGAAFSYLHDLSITTSFQTPLGLLRSVSTSNAVGQQYSAEYVWKAWTFQSEGCFIDDTSDSPGTSDQYGVGWYASAAYRFNDWLEAGAYYNEYYIQGPIKATFASHSDTYQKDAAIAVRFDLTDRWIFKIEGHYIQGTALLQDNDLNPVRRGNGWGMIDLKSTISF